MFKYLSSCCPLPVLPYTKLIIIIINIHNFLFPLSKIKKNQIHYLRLRESFSFSYKLEKHTHSFESRGQYCTLKKKEEKNHFFSNHPCYPHSISCNVAHIHFPIFIFVCCLLCCCYYIYKLLLGKIHLSYILPVLSPIIPTIYSLGWRILHVYTQKSQNPAKPPSLPLLSYLCPHHQPNRCFGSCLFFFFKGRGFERLLKRRLHTYYTLYLPTSLLFSRNIYFRSSVLY